jgi:hypothetical protein
MVSSWPGLSRPSTSLNLQAPQDVDARPKAGHDGPVANAVPMANAMIEVRRVKSVGGFRLAVEFSNDMQGERDFSSLISDKTGPMAEPLKDPAYFARAFIEDGALTWPNGYDWDPIALHDEMKEAGKLRPVESAAE